ncbi:MAG: hypothetical protein K2M82_00470, partial [Lachnospiraceae bacterium]|nr:hypothetical protein [Lachnospiraceae bacterium]
MKNNNRNSASRPFYKRMSFWVILAIIIIKLLKVSDDLREFEEYLPSPKRHEPQSNDKLYSPYTMKVRDRCNLERESLALHTEHTNESKSNNTTKIDKIKISHNKEKEHEKSIFRFVLNNSTKKYHTKSCAAERRLTGEKREETQVEASS